MWALTLAGISVGAAVAGYFMLRRKSGDDLSKVAGDSWDILKNWEAFMDGELSSVGAYLAHVRLMYAIGETYLRIEEALERGDIDRAAAERLHQGLIQRVYSIAGENSLDLIACSVALADYLRKNKIDVRKIDIGTASELYDVAKTSAEESGLMDRVLSDTEYRLARAEDIASSEKKSQPALRR